MSRFPFQRHIQYERHRLCTLIIIEMHPGSNSMWNVSWNYEIDDQFVPTPFHIFVILIECYFSYISHLFVHLFGIFHTCNTFYFLSFIHFQTTDISLQQYCNSKSTAQYAKPPCSTIRTT